MYEPIPALLVPGLLCSGRLFEPQIPSLRQIGPVTIADHTRDASMADIARRILAAAPPRFHLVGLSMGGYIAFEILRQAMDRVAKVVLLDTGPRPEIPEQTARRRTLMELARTKGLTAVNDCLVPFLVHESRQADKSLRAIVDSMAEEVGLQAFLRQQEAIIGRPDSRPDLPTIRCPTLVVVGDSDRLTPPELSREIAGGIPGARLEIIAGCGHLSTLEMPDAVNRLLVTWLAA
jgi:pimeloyl-ACP methyl ester carboxylesterase